MAGAVGVFHLFRSYEYYERIAETQMAEHLDYRYGKDLHHPLPELYTTFLDAFEVTAEVLLSPIDVRMRCSCLLCPSCLSLLHAHTHTLSRSISISLSHAHTQTHTHTLSLSHTHTHMRSQMTSFIAAYAGSCRLRKSRIFTTQISRAWTRSLVSFSLPCRSDCSRYFVMTVTRGVHPAF